MSLFSVNTNIGALAALQSLDMTQQAMNAAQNQMSTGQKVASASDNPAIYSIANTINANIAGLSAVSDSLNFGAQVVATAASAVSNVNSVLQSLQQTVTSSNTSGEDLATLQSQVTNELQSINQYASSATFSGVNLLVATAPTGGSNSLNIVQSVDGTAYSVANQLGSGTDLVNYLGLSSLNVNAGSGISTMGANIAFGTGTTVGTAGTASGTFVHTGTKTNNAFQLSYSTTDSKGVVTNRTMTFEFIDNANGSTNTQLQNAASSTNTEVAVNFDSSKDSTNQIVADLAQAIQSNGFGLVQQPDGSLNIVGGGLTGVDYGTASAGSFTSGGAKVTSASSTTTAQSESNGVSVLNLSTNKVNVTAVTSAVTKLNTISASLGAATQQITGMQNFTTALSSALTAGVGALTDADLAAESAQLSSLQTKQQLATQSLSIANQAPQSLLSLFKNL